MMDPLLYTIPENSNINITNNIGNFTKKYENKISLIISRISDNRCNIFTHCIFFFDLLNKEDTINASIEFTRIRSLIKLITNDLNHIKQISKILKKTNKKYHNYVIEQLHNYNDFKIFNKDKFILVLNNILIIVQQYNSFKHYLYIYTRHINNSPPNVKLKFLELAIRHFYYLKHLYTNTSVKNNSTVVFINYIKTNDIKFIDRANTLKNIHNIFKKIESIVL